jgi:lysozyme
MPEGPIHEIFSEPYTYGGVQSVEYLRLYNPHSFQHHWTTDRNEYDILGSLGWAQEGRDGYILPAAAPGTMPVYRLYFDGFGGLHLWTSDANEVNVLTTQRGWVFEGIAGHVLPVR